MHESGPQLGVAVVGARRGEQAKESILRAADVRLELRVRTRDRRQLRVQRQGALQTRLGPLQIVLGTLASRLAEHPVAATEVDPRRRILWIGLDALEIEISRQASRFQRHQRRLLLKLVRAQVELVGRRIRRYVVLQQLLLTSGQWERQ